MFENGERPGVWHGPNPSSSAIPCLSILGVTPGYLNKALISEAKIMVLSRIV